jgi:predicted Zn-dependent peptidase
MAARLGSRPSFKKTVFDNGLTLISERHSQFRSLSIGIWVKVGTRHELPPEAGASHFLEHMLFKGTEARTALDIAREVDRVGGDFNAFTAREYTCFHILLLDRDVSLGLEILSDIVLNSNFDAEELERERKVILQEIAMVEDSHEELAHDLYFELLYGRHGLGKPILGTERSIRRMKRADLLKFFRQHYRPDQLIVSVAGNVSHETLKKKLKPLARREWPGRPKGSVKRKTGDSPAPKLKPGRWWVERPAEQAHLIWGVEGPKYASRDRFAAFLLNVYLGGGMSSALFQEIREKNGLAYTVYSSLSPFLDSGVFSIYVGTSIQNVPVCLKLIEECIIKLKRDLLTEDELQVTKENLKGTILLSADNVESRMSSIATNEIFFRDHVPLEEVCRRIDEVTPADLKRVARKILRTDNTSILALGPKPSQSVRKKLRAWAGGPWQKLGR